MTLITIPKKMAQKGDLAIVPRKEYEEFLEFKKIRTFRLTAAQRRALRRARRDFARGNYITLDQLRREMGSRHTS